MTTKVEPEQAYKAGVELLRQRTRRLLASREDALTLLIGGLERWFQLTPWSELPDHDREFWSIISELLNDSGLGIEAINTVLETGAKSAQAARKETEALLAKCGRGKGWEQ